MSKQIFIDTFNNHIEEFIEDLLLYPDDKDIKTGATYQQYHSLINLLF